MKKEFLFCFITSLRHPFPSTLFINFFNIYTFHLQPSAIHHSLTMVQNIKYQGRCWFSTISNMEFEFKVDFSTNRINENINFERNFFFIYFEWIRLAVASVDSVMSSRVVNGISSAYFNMYYFCLHVRFIFHICFGHFNLMFINFYFLLKFATLCWIKTNDLNRIKYNTWFDNMYIDDTSIE